MATLFWLKNPNILLKTDEFTHIWPTTEMTFEAKLNAISRLVIVLTLLGYMLTQQKKVLLSGLVTLGAVILLYLIRTNQTQQKEGYTNAEIQKLIKTNLPCRPTTIPL